jgi:hypothetical protein
MRRTLGPVLLLALAALFAAVPSPATAETTSSPARCASLGTEIGSALGTDSGTTGTALDFTWLTGSGCLSGFCQSVADCPCATATSITCNGTCHYTFPGGGGGGGNPHGCLHGRCTTSANCRCSDGTFAACVSGLCTF